MVCKKKKLSKPSLDDTRTCVRPTLCGAIADGIHAYIILYILIDKNNDNNNTVRFLIHCLLIRNTVIALL